MTEEEKLEEAKKKIAQIKLEYELSKNPPKVCVTPEDDTCESCQG